MDDNFLVQVLDRPTRGEVLLGLVLTNMKEVKIGSSLGCHDHAQVEFMISTHMGLAKNVESGP